MIYNKGGSSIIVSFLAGSSFDGVVTNVTESPTATTTGLCGSTSSPTNLTCYLRAADGVINLSADAGDTPLPDLVTFADGLAAALGVS